MTYLKNKAFLSKFKNNIPIYLTIFLPYLMSKIINHEKRVYIISALLLFLILLLYRKKELLDDLYVKFFSKLENINIYFIYMGLLIFTFITQNVYLDYETVSWDIPSYLVASLPIGDGYLPYEIQWESKGPVLMYVYYFLILISGKSYIIFRLINDFILFVISIFLFKSVYSISNKNKVTSSMSSILFLSLFSDPQYISEYSELYILLLLSITTYLYIKEKFSDKNILMIPLLISLTSLINQVAILFIIPYFILMYRNNLFNKRSFIRFAIGLLFPQVIIVSIYFLNNEFNILIANYFLIPLGYTNSGEVNSINELRIWLREYFYFNKFLYFSIFTLLSLEILRITKQLKFNSFFNIVHLNFVISLTIYLLGNHGYTHHLMYFVYFSMFFIANLKINNTYFVLFAFLLISSSSIFVKSFNKSYENLSNIAEIQENYPVYKLSQEIERQFENDYDILALEYVLVLFYLDKPNYSYIVHPTNHFEEYIEQPLIQFDKIKKNNVEQLLLQKPDVIICNSMRIHRGVPTDNTNFKCDYEHYQNEYNQIETTIYRKNIKVEYYFDPYKNMNVFIKKG